MGRAKREVSAVETGRARNKAQQRFTLKGLYDDAAAIDIEKSELLNIDDVGSAEHVDRIEAYCQARAKRRVYVTFNSWKESSAFTDMGDHININNDRPEGATDPRLIALVMNAQARHEMCHIDYTDPATFHKFIAEIERIGREVGLDTAAKTKDIWNMLEDGMIEERERTENPFSYAYLSARNKIDPKVGATQITEEEGRTIYPGYAPVIDGKKLKVEDLLKKDGTPALDENGKPIKVVVIPKGTKMEAWGKKPISLIHQAEAAILASALPEYEVGDLHPKVAKALKECDEHIDAAVRGNTADCAIRAVNIHNILNKHGLLAPETKDPETQEAIRQMQQQMLQQLMQQPSAPQMLQQGQQGQQGQQQANPQQGPMSQQAQQMMQAMQGQSGEGQEDGQSGQQGQQGQQGGQSGQQGDQSGQQGDQSSQNGQQGDQSGQHNHNQGGQQKSAGAPGEKCPVCGVVHTGSHEHHSAKKDQSSQGQSGDSGQSGSQKDSAQGDSSQNKSQGDSGKDGQQGDSGQSQSGQGDSGQSQSGQGDSGQSQSGQGDSGQSGQGQSGQGDSGQSGQGQSGQGSQSGQGDSGQSGQGQSGQGDSGQSGQGSQSGQSGQGQSGQGDSGQSGQGDSGQSGQGQSGQGDSGQSGQGSQSGQGQSGQGDSGQSGQGSQSGQGDSGQSGQGSQSGQGDSGQSGQGSQSGQGQSGQGSQSGQGDSGQSGQGSQSGQGDSGQSGQGQGSQSGPGLAISGQSGPASTQASQMSGSGDADGSQMMPGSQMGAPTGPGGSGGAGGINTDRFAASAAQAKALAEGQREKNDRESRGSVSKAELDKLLQQEAGKLKEDKIAAAKQAKNVETQGIRKGRFDGNSWNMPEGHYVTAQKDIKASTRAHNAQTNNAREHQYGRKLAQELRNLQEESRRSVTGLRKGRRVDSRKYASALAGREDVMRNPGVSENQRVRVDVVVDRSGSVMQSPSNNQGQQVMAKMFGYMDREARGAIPTSIYGFDGGWSNTGHYAFKEAHSHDLSAIDGLASTGGGGTPTGDAVEFSRARLGRSKEKNKVMAVVTDGAAQDLSNARAQVDAARREGIAVLGLAFECRDSDMNELFGPGNWERIVNYQDAPRLVGRMIDNLVRKNRRKKS